MRDTPSEGIRGALGDASYGRSSTPPLARLAVYRPVKINQFHEYVAVRDEKKQLLFKEEFEVIKPAHAHTYFNPCMLTLCS